MTDGGAVGLVARSRQGATLQCGSVGKVASAERAGWQCGGPWVASRWAVRRQLPDRGWLGGSVAPWRDPTLWQGGHFGRIRDSTSYWLLLIEFLLSSYWLVIGIFPSKNVS